MLPFFLHICTEYFNYLLSVLIVLLPLVSYVYIVLQRRKTTVLSSRENFMKCHEALHTLLKAIIPCLKNVIDSWHQKVKQTHAPCSNPNQCPPNKKPSAKIKSCQECINWANVIEAEVYPPTAKGTLQWTNVKSTLFSENSIEFIKLFAIRIQANQSFSTLDDFDTASLLMVMSKFNQFHHGDKTTFDKINSVSQIFMLILFLFKW